MKQEIIIHEVGLRDGLQMEHRTVPIETKVAWAEELMDAGMDIIQLGSFVHPERVPQMRDTDELFRHFTAAYPQRRTVFSGLVLNEKGLERGLACGVEMFCMGVSASETHSRKNTGMGTDEAVTRIVAMARLAEGAGKKVQLSVQSAFGCGYEGAVSPARVTGIAAAFFTAGFGNISLADTAGHATPGQVEELFGAVREMDPRAALTCHFHNTYGLAVANAWAALQAGVTSVESSVAGLGGCPFTKIAGGNLCTEDFVHMLQRMDLRLDIDLEKLLGTARSVAGFFERELPGTVYRVGPIADHVSSS
jgi:hydroxymethylglutaryl-CoA lyase